MTDSLLVQLVHVQEPDILVSELELLILCLPVPGEDHPKAAGNVKIQENLKSSLQQNK